MWHSGTPRSRPSAATQSNFHIIGDDAISADFQAILIRVRSPHPRVEKLDFPPMPPPHREVMVRIAASFNLIYEVGKSLPGVERLSMTLFKTLDSRV